MVEQSGLEASFNVIRSGFSLEVALKLPLKGVTAIFGHSGSGKTTLLRCIAGLERASLGRLTLHGQVWQDAGVWVPPHRRSVGYVFQEASLFPHLTVQGNLQYAVQRVRGKSRVSLEQVSQLLGITPLLARRPEGLSGGERQRVAIARAILTSPELLLLDEPLASLDQQSKSEILPFLDHLASSLGIPMIYVTHSLDEVMRLADHLVLMHRGVILHTGPVAESVTRLDLPLAQDEEAESLFQGEVVRHWEEDHLTEVNFQGRRLLLTRRPVEPGQRVRLRIKAKNVSLILKEPQDSSILNFFPAQVAEISLPGMGGTNPAKVIIKLDLDGAPLLAHITQHSCRRLNLHPGMQLYAQVKSIGLM